MGGAVQSLQAGAREGRRLFGEVATEDFSASPSLRSVGAKGSEDDCQSQCQAIQDVDEGWEGFCLGLQMLGSNTTAEACREHCCADPKCEVWQWGNRRELAGNRLGSCFTGRGLECSSDRFDNFLVLKGQRISHGSVTDKVALEKGMWCTGPGMRQAPMPSFSASSGSYKRILQECREACYKDASCSLWEHSSVEGCWYGSSEQCSVDGPASLTMIAGERVARACGPGLEAQGRTDYLRVFGIIGFVGLLLTCVAILALICGALTGLGGPGLRSKFGDDVGQDSKSRRKSLMSNSQGSSRRSSEDGLASDVSEASQPASSTGSTSPTLHGGSGESAGLLGVRGRGFAGSPGSPGRVTTVSYTPFLQPQAPLVQVSPYMPLGQAR